MSKMRRHPEFLFDLLLIIAFGLGRSSAATAIRFDQMIPFEECITLGAPTPFELISLTITGCTSGYQCKLKKYQTVTVTAEFQILGDSLSARKLTHEAYWIMRTIHIKATITPESCEGLWCPTLGANGFKYTAQVYVNGTLPTDRGSLYWKTKDENNNLKMCYKIPVDID